MPKLLCKISDSFAIEGRGTVAVLESTEDWRIPRDERVHRREMVRILRPDQTSLQTFIKDFDFVRRPDGKESIALTFPNDVKAEHAPPGSTIFLEREDDVPIYWDGQPPK